ncbi:nucleoside/nucleotide kinase family protein [Sphingobium cloacae]|uniref:Thymidylate kinase n=1 Tax=Sphingobium cloacae TaxID=120107 RepID=A0A1E1EZP2_9SPHN|nr:hypothetical protein [Sphingobium cloacae]BAV63735.1 hypothetical protein SCLO_1006950 [Sphingobium cloacae]
MSRACSYDLYRRDDTAPDNQRVGREASLACNPGIHPREPLAGLIAVVGSDGSGKSTLTADLFTHLCDGFVTHRVYLGQDSGNILRAILGVPLLGPVIGRFLVRKSRRAHAEGGKPADPDALTAIALYLLSRWRRRKFRRMLALHRQGGVIVTDRYPQAEAGGFYFDGPGLSVTPKAGAFVRWLAARERRLYEEMSAYIPTLVIRLNVDAETAHARKPDHKLAMLRDKVRVIPTLAFNGASIVDLDGAAPYPAVLEAALAATHAALTTAASKRPATSLERRRPQVTTI